MTGFWSKLNKPFFVLAPMADVTDAAFRRIIAKYSKYGGRAIGDGSKESLLAEAFRRGGPDVTWTEFVSADGLFLGGREKLMRDLVYSDAERPVVAQFFTSRPDMMERAASLARELGFDGIDINMGCPDRSVEKQGGGAALIKTPDRAKEVIRAAQKGAGSLPVSVKTRLGYNVDQVETWIPAILETEPAALTIHARTRKEMSKVPARWENVARVVSIRDSLKAPTLIIGNGDVINISDARMKAESSGADGVMLGRAIFGNPWLFSDRQPEDISLREKLETLVEHIELFDELLGDVKSFAVMKKHFKAYISGFEGAHEFRARLMECVDKACTVGVIEQYIADHF